MPEGLTPILYTEPKLDAMRKELLSAKEKVKEDNKLKTYSWPRFSRLISETVPELVEKYHEWIPSPYRESGQVYLKSNDWLRQFCVLNKITGEYAALPDNQYIAIDLWLTDPENIYSDLSRQQLHGYELNNLREAAIFANYLYEGIEHIPFLKPNKFNKLYSSKSIRKNRYLKNRKYCDHISLIVQESKQHPYLVSVAISGKRYLINKDDTVDYELEPDLLNLSGWLVLSPEENIFFFLKDHDLKVNHMYIPISINEDAFSNSGKIDEISFVDRVEVELASSISLEKTQELLSNWVNSNESNVIVFKSIQKS